MYLDIRFGRIRIFTREFSILSVIWTLHRSELAIRVYLQDALVLALWVKKIRLHRGQLSASWLFF